MAGDDYRIKTVIIDGDETVHERIEDVLNSYKDFELLESCTTGAEGIEAIKGTLPDVVFLETKLPDMSGFDVIQRSHPVQVPEFVFLSKSRQEAVQAFEFFAFDYILKPFTPERLHLTLMKVKEDFYRRSGEKLHDKLNALFRYMSQTDPDTKAREMNGDTLLPVKMGGRIYFLREEEVEYIEASGYYIEVYANGKKHLIRQSLSGMIKKLDARKFQRIHRSVIINIKYLKEIVKTGTSDFSVRMADGSTFRISKSYKSDVFEAIGIRS